MYLAKVFIHLKPNVSDPEGKTIQGGLHSLGFNSIKDVRFGKYIEIVIDSNNKSDASNQVDGMCSKLLANPVIEQYSFQLSKLKGLKNSA